MDPSPLGWYEAAFGGPPDAQGRTLYVTFDDGPAAATPEVLSSLERYGAKATFFVIGQQAANNPNTLAQIVAAGHALGNHTWSHPDLATMSREQVASELALTLEAAPNAGGCMRPPFGSIEATSGTVSEEMGLQPIMWTGQAFDWRPPPVEKIVADIKAVTKPGAVILLHDGGGDRTNTVAALQQLLPFWVSEGYSLKPIPACQ
jgi:peptidoglycan/xylan/chitin deacetylase (PgdA/CDA1 family)